MVRVSFNLPARSAQSVPLVCSILVALPKEILGIFILRSRSFIGAKDVYQASMPNVGREQFFCKRDLKLMMKKLLRAVLMSIILYIASQIAQMLISKMESGNMFSSKNMSSYETQIMSCKIDAKDISETLDSIGGLSSIKNDIKMQILLPLSRPSIFFNQDVAIMKPPKGILLHGPPGTGKTMLAKAIAKEANCPFLSLSLSSLENKYYGETSKLLKATFSVARKIQPCILFFDEIDGMIRTRSDFDQSYVYGMKTEFLSQIDGISSSPQDSVIMIACTNCVDSLDPAVRRRLPHKYLVGLPTKDELKEIVALQIESAGETISKTDVSHMIDATRSGVTGSDLKNVVESAGRVHMMECAENERFQNAIKRPEVTASEIKCIIGSVTREHLLKAFVSMKFIDESKLKDDFFESKESKESKESREHTREAQNANQVQLDSTADGTKTRLNVKSVESSLLSGKDETE